MEFSEGYVYFAYGRSRFVKQAQISAESLLKYQPDADITLFTDKEGVFQPFDVYKTHYWPNIMPDEANGKRDGVYEGKMLNLYKSPYDRTMVLDTDTYFLGDPSGLFELLNYYDFVLSQSPSHLNIMEKDGHRVEGLVPFNSGVMLYRKSPVARMVLTEDVKRLWIERRGILKTHRMDLYLTLALAASTASVGPLPANYNCRPPCFVDGPVKIYHYAGRRFSKKELEEVHDDLNENTKKRYIFK